ncbi:MAG TPA: S9 family peptidase [Longimicrobiales bacterium]|nr:S9 family peptidase [Longimicrobiales bacterium]
MTRSALAALVACAVLPGFAPAQTLRSLSYDDFYRFESAGQVALSPDGRQVVFVRSWTLEEENRNHAELWLVSTDGAGTPTRLTSPSTEASAPAWSPDGRLLAFASRRSVAGDRDGGTTWFLRMDAPGEAFRIPGVGGPPRFDPTNRWIAFTRAVPPKGPRPQADAPSTDAERKIAERFDGKAFDWMGYRFDRRGYLADPRDPWATPPDQLFVVPREGGEPRQLTHLDVDVGGPAWRPDGGALAFVADTHQRDERSYERADLWMVTLDGTVSRLSDDEFDYGSPAWSPDGRWIATRGGAGLDVVIRERWNHGAPTDLWLFSSDGRERRNLTEDFDLLPGAPEWSPDGRWIYFSSGTGGNSHLFRVPATGGSPEMLTTGDRRVGSVSFSDDHERFAYVAQTPVDPGDVYVAETRDPRGTERRLTGLNAELLASLDLQVPSRQVFSSPDGTQVEGWVLPPAGYREGDGRAWPLILNVHGGPHGAYGNEFSFERQLQAAQGYFVLYTNPRGSTGYGEDFLWGTWGSWGDEDYDDVMAGVDHVLSRYPVDPARMGVTGYSYGGYMANWIITQTDRFAAAVAGAGISNWMSDYGTADIPRTKESEFFGAPWEEEGLKNLLASSPIVHAAGVSTPTLFVHGESDHRVPIEEAEQMYTALQKQGVPARMIRYPDSYHGGWTPWRLVHRYWSSMQWWEQWLREKPIS